MGRFFIVIPRSGLTPPASKKALSRGTPMVGNHMCWAGSGVYGPDIAACVYGDGAKLDSRLSGHLRYSDGDRSRNSFVVIQRRFCYLSDRDDVARRFASGL